MHPVFQRALLAVLPLLGAVLSGERAELKSLFALGWLGMTLLGFSFAHVLLPQRVHRLSIFLVLVTGGIILRMPLYAVGLLILLPPELFRHRKSWKKTAPGILLTGFIYWTLLAGVSVLAQIYPHPALSFFLMGFLALFFRREAVG